MGAAITKPPVFLSGGGGLVSTAHDYHRFAEMLRRGGELDGVRLLGPRTVRYMGTNHLPGGVDLEAFGQSTFAETTFDGVGFGLGFAVVQDPAATKVLSSAGEMSWGGAASTGFFVDPVEDITAVFLTQLLPVEHLRPAFPAQAGVVPSSPVVSAVLRRSGGRGHRARPAVRDRRGGDRRDHPDGVQATSRRACASCSARGAGRGDATFLVYEDER